jgi:UPF0176 protein
MTPPTTLNIAAYHFTQLSDASALADKLRSLCVSLGLKGTILLAEEGINLFLAGSPDHIESFCTELTSDPRLTNMAIKRSESASQPFKKLLVKIKAEIIRMNCPTIKPSFDQGAQVRAPAVDAQTLKRWLDAGVDDSGKPVVMLDTRNDFEIDYGTFDNAIDWQIQKFSDFPAAFEAHKAELAGKTIVSFCTGGIRCEKAAIYMRESLAKTASSNFGDDGGYGDVYQLEGGILKYFEEVQSAHYKGGCFVFDQRESLDASLKPQDLGNASRFSP